MAIGHCKVASRITWESGVYSYACVHMGDHNLVGGVREFGGDEAHAEMRADLEESFGKVDFPEIVRRLDDYFGGLPFSLTTLFREEQRKIVEILLRSSLERVNAAYRQQFEQQSLLALFLGELGISIPPAFRTTAQMVLNADLREALDRSPLDVERIRHLLADAKAWQVELDEAGLSHQLAHLLQQRALVLRDHKDRHAALTALNTCLDVVDMMPFSINLIKPQNIVYKLWRDRCSQGAESTGLDAQAVTLGKEPLKAVAARLSIRVAD